MTNFEKTMVGVMVALTLAVVGLASTSFLKTGNINISVNGNTPVKTLASGETLGSAQTVATYATAETVTNQGGLYLWDTESSSGLEVAGYARFNGIFASLANTRAASLVQTGAIATFTTTSAATAANVCDNPLWTITPAVAAATVTLPATSTLLADCLTTNGDSINLTLLNGSGTTSTVIAAGAGGTLLYSSSTTIAAGKGATLRVVRDATATYKAFLTNQAN